MGQAQGEGPAVETMRKQSGPSLMTRWRSSLAGPALERMQDLMRFGALTGARLDAIVDLRVKDCANGVFTFKPQKKRDEAPRRPHSPGRLRQVVTRRTAGKDDDDSLFPEWPSPKKAGSNRERSFKASNAFTEYRRLVGVDEESRRQAPFPSQLPFLSPMVHHEGGEGWPAAPHHSRRGRPQAPRHDARAIFRRAGARATPGLRQVGEASGISVPYIERIIFATRSSF